MNSVTDLLPFCDNPNVCQLIVVVYAITAMFIVTVAFVGVTWLYRVLVRIKTREFVELYYGFTDTKR